MTEAIASETISSEFEGARLSFMNCCYNCRFHRHHWDGFLKRRCVAPDEIGFTPVDPDQLGYHGPSGVRPAAGAPSPSRR
jgi:hypothetical protein